MKNIGSRISAISFLGILLGLSTLASASEKVLHYFTAGKDGFGPQNSVVFDAAGTLYGVAPSGGAYDLGIVYMLTPTATGPWKETILHHFSGSTDGAEPTALAIDAAGNLYGIAQRGKPAHGTPLCKMVGCGTIFRLSPGAGGWRFNLLHSFTGLNDGAYPTGITLDAGGNIFVPTFGSTLNAGTVFEMSPSASGLNGHFVYVFSWGTADGREPNGPVALDAAGNLFGTTQYGGAFGLGAIYEISPTGGGQWTEKVIYSFTGAADGEVPQRGLTIDASGNVFGAADSGASGNYGVVFELAPVAGGAWIQTVLYTFKGGSDGAYPTAGPIFDAAGNLYGTTFLGGTVNSGLCNSGCGVAYKLAPGPDGWSQSVLYTFLGGSDGAEPWAIPIIDAAGNLYSVTRLGGRANSQCLEGCGVVFAVPTAISASK